MLITKRYFKKSMGFIIAVIMIIAGFTVFSTEVYADSYKISTEVDGTMDIQYTVNYDFEEHYKPDASWTCNGYATKTTTFSVPVKVKVTRDTNGEASYSISLENKISNWRLECYAFASGMKPDQGSYIILEGNARFNFTDSGEDDLSSIYYGEASDKEVDLTSKGCEFNVTNFFDDNPDWQVDRYIENIKRVDKITLKFTYPEIAERNYTLTFDPDGGTLKNPGSNLYNPEWNNGNSVTVTTNTSNFCSMSDDCPIREGYSFTGWYRAYWKQDGTIDHLEQIYDSAGNAINGTSLWGYWDNSWHWLYEGDMTLWAGWTRNSYILDLNATYNHSTNLGGLKDGGLDLGTCDVYIYDDDGNVWDKATDVTDYYKQVPYGYTYEVKNFSKNAGYIFCDNNTLKGNIKAENNEARIYVYNGYALAYYDGNGATGGQYEAGNGSDYFV